MDLLGAADWVRNNEYRIRRKFRRHLKFSPYEDEDYLQEAYLSAFVAVRRSDWKGIPFEAAFWIIFSEHIGKMTPNHKRGSSGSKSVPSCLCKVEISSTVIALEEMKEMPDIEAIYQKISCYLTSRERSVLSIALGITYEGNMSNYEIAELLGCSESNVRDALKKALGRVENLVRLGIIDPEEIL